MIFSMKETSKIHRKSNGSGVPMQVFISWSGDQARALAVAMRQWLPRVLAQKVTAFVSSEDIAKGARGLSVIATELESCSFGIVIVTRSNLKSSWINFEAGAIGKSVSNGMVAPLLLGLADSDLDGPLKQFQNTVATDRDAVRALVQSINNLHEDPLDSDAVNILFDASWPSLEGEISSALSLDSSTPEPKRSNEDILDEVLTTVRTLQREVTKLSATPRASLSFRPEPDNSELTNRPFASRGIGSALRLAKKMLDSILPEPTTHSLVDAPHGRLVVDLGGKYPPIGVSVLDEIRALSKNLEVRIVLFRQDGTAVRLDEDGLESRRAPGSDDWIMQLTGAEEEF